MYNRHDLQESEVTDEKLEAVKKAWKLGAAKINQILNGYSPLTYCIDNNNSYAKELIARGADPNKSDGHGKTPLIYAIDRNSLQIVQLLIENGANLTAFSALSYALDSNKSDIAIFLLKSNKSFINCLLPDGHTTLTKALIQGNARIAKYLLENGASATKKDSHSLEPLNLALGTSSLDIIKLLVSRGATIPTELDIDVLNEVMKRNNLQLYRFLTEHCWNIDQVYNNEKISWSKVWERKPNISFHMENDRTLLYFYALQQDLTFTVFFIKNGAKLKNAERELEKFRKDNSDFDFFMEQYEHWSQEFTGQE